MSSNGQKIIAADNATQRFYVSSNKGDTWIIPTLNGSDFYNYYGASKVNVSADGSLFQISFLSYPSLASQFAYSSNGSNFNLSSNPTTTAPAMFVTSSNGLIGYSVNAGNYTFGGTPGFFYTSDGINWSQNWPLEIPQYYWSLVSCSYDGLTLMMYGINAADVVFLLLSTDGGSTYSFINSSQPFSSNFNCSALAVSGDGQSLVVSNYDTDYLYIATGGSTSFTQIFPSSYPNKYYSVRMSYNGSVIAAATGDETSVQISYDYASTSMSLYGMTLSANANVQLATDGTNTGTTVLAIGLYSELFQRTQKGKHYSLSLSNVYTSSIMGIQKIENIFDTGYSIASNIINMNTENGIYISASETGAGESYLAFDGYGFNFQGPFFTLSASGGDVNIVTSLAAGYLKLAVAAIHSDFGSSADLGTGGNPFNNVYASNYPSVSDERKKTQIQASDLGLNFITQLSSTKYKFKIGQNYLSSVTFSTFSTIVSSCSYSYLLSTQSTFVNYPQISTQSTFVYLPQFSKKSHIISTFTSTTVFHTSTVFQSTIITSRPGKRTHYGLVAQQVRSTLNTLGVSDFAGYVLADKEDPSSDQMLSYMEFIAPIIKSIQELYTIVQAQQSTIDSLVAKQ